MQSAFLLACVAGGVWWLWRQLRFTSLLRSSLVIGGAWLGTALLTTTGLLLSHGPSFGFRVAEAISEHEFHGEQTTLTLIGEPAHASRIRICSGGRIRVEHIFPRDAELRPPVGPTATAEDGYLVALPENRALLTIPFGFNEVTLWDASQAWWDGNLSNYIKTHQRVYHVAIPDPVDDRGGPATRVVSQPVGDIATR